MTLMDHKAFFTTFAQTLDKIVSKPGIPQPVRDDFAQLKNNAGLMNTLAGPLLKKIQQFVQVTVLCRYVIDGITFCDNFPEELCVAVGGTPVSSCGGFPGDWSAIDFTA